MTQNWKIIQALLEKRGLITKEEQLEFLNPIKPDKITLGKIGLTSSAITKAVKRLKTIRTNKELIYIYGDYDTDGVSSTAILWEALNSLGFQVMPFIPSRDDSVRGLSPMGIEMIIKQAKEKPGLIITVDNGISAFKGCREAKKLGIDVIITDHHLPRHKNNQPYLPEALAIIHTTQLAGAGVAWFFAREIIKAFKPHSRGVNFFHLGNELLDFAALGTIADMVPLQNVNRSLAKFGLDKLRSSQRPGLITLAKTANFDLKDLEDYQVSYVLAPRLNALGRLEHALDALRLLCTTDIQRADRLAAHLNQTNQLRQDKTASMLQHARAKFLKQGDQPLIFVASKTYHEGVVGLVAGKLVEEFNRPAIIIALGKNFSKASSRSLKGFNVLKAIRSLEPYLLEYGGHELAAGFTVDNKNLKIVAKKLLSLAKKSLLNKKLEPAIEIDCELNFNQINWKLFNALEEFKPFGFANPQPLFATKKVKLLNFRSVGKDSKHLKLSLQGDSSQVNAIAFSFGHLAQKLKSNQLIDITYTLEANDWNHKKTLQLKIKEIKI